MLWFWLMQAPIFQSWFHLIINIKSVGLGFINTSNIWLNLYWINQMMPKMTTFTPVIGVNCSCPCSSSCLQAAVSAGSCFHNDNMAKKKKNSLPEKWWKTVTPRVTFMNAGNFLFSSLTLIWKKGTFTSCRSFKHVRLQHRNRPNMNLLLTIQNKYEHILKLTTVSTHPSPVICSCRLWEYDCVYMWGQPCVPTAPCTPKGLDNMAGLWLMVMWRTQPWNGGRLACRPATGIPSGGQRNSNQWSQPLSDQPPIGLGTALQM